MCEWLTHCTEREIKSHTHPLSQTRDDSKRRNVTFLPTAYPDWRALPSVAH